MRNADRPFVYLRFDHVGEGVRRNQNELSLRIWLRFVNNCNVSIVVHASGTMKGMLAGEVNVWDRVVPDQPTLEITSFASMPVVEHEHPSETGKGSEMANGDQQTAKQMPSGYEDEVGSSFEVSPGASVLFSLPIDHVGTRSGRWHMEVPFWFGVPKGHGPRDPAVGGEPVMSVWYSRYDLPTEAQAIISKAE